MLDIIPIYVVISVTLVLIVGSLFNPTYDYPDAMFLFTNAVIGIVAFVMLLFENRKQLYSLHMMHWLFQYVFFFVAPLVQYLNNSFPMGMLDSDNVDVLHQTNLIILVWQISWIAGKALLTKKMQRNIAEPFQERAMPDVKNSRIVILLLLSFAVLVYMVTIYGFSGLFTRGAVAVDKISSSLSITLLFLTVGRAIPAVLLVYLASRKRDKGVGAHRLLMALTLGIVLLTNFPAATPRFWAASMYLGILISVVGIKYRNVFIYLLLIGLNIVFPILGQTRNAETFQGFIQMLTSNNFMFTKNLLTWDYDAYSMLSYTHIYISEIGTTNAKQLLTAILFFIPRSVWPGKAVGSGSTVADYLNFGFNNISCPLPAEGLINFGMFGVIVFAVLFSAGSLYIDKLYWLKQSVFIQMVYPFWLVLFFFMMRGDLLSTFSYLVGLTASFYLFVNFRKKRTPGTKGT